MKNILFFIFFLSQCVVCAQDTIYKRTGEIIAAKVSEVNIKEISYKRSDLLDGPLFIIHKNEIKKIRYYNGTIDSFAVVKDMVTHSLINNHGSVYVLQNNINEIHETSRKGVFMYQGQHVSERKVMYLALDKNQYWKNDDINYYSTQFKKNKSLQYSIGFGGAAVGGAAIGASLLSLSYNSSANDNAISATVAAAGISVLVASQIVSATFKFKAVKHSNKLAELFNQLSKN